MLYLQLYLSDQKNRNIPFIFVLSYEKKKKELKCTDRSTVCMRTFSMFLKSEGLCILIAVRVRVEGATKLD